MKKVIIAEIAVLALLLVGILIGCYCIAQPAFSEAPVQTDPAETDDTTATEPSTEVPTTAFVPDWPTYPANRALLAKQYFVYDCNSESFLSISGAQDERVYPASITKLFTAYVAMQYLKPDTQITAGSALDLVAWGSSVAKIQTGDVLTVEQLVEAMMLPSGNDAAYILAVEAGRAIMAKSEQITEDGGQSSASQLDAISATTVFMNEMNEQALALGMTGTHFVNPDGIHDEYHYTTFEDLTILGKLAMENETIMQYAVIAKEQMTLHGETIEWKNTNALIDPNSPYYCRYAVGLKTGQTPSAGSCLLSAFIKDGQELLIGVFGCPEEEDRFDDTLQLFNEVVLE